MDIQDSISMEEKCENLMNVVVETRKRFGKMCVEYERKCSLMENEMLNLQLETISNYKFKPKHAVPSADLDSMSKDADDFAKEVMEKQKRINRLLENIRNTQDVVLQMKRDNIGQKLRAPLSAQALLARAKGNS